MLKIEPGNETLTDGQIDGRTDRQTDRRTLERKFFLEGIT